MHSNIAGGGVLVKQAGAVHLFRAVAVQQSHVQLLQAGGLGRRQIVEIIFGQIKENLARVQIVETELRLCGHHLILHVKGQLRGFTPLTKSILQTQAHRVLARPEKSRRLAQLGNLLALVVLPGISEVNG